MEPGAPVELHVRREGSGPTVLLLHGLGGDHSVWNAVIPGLTTEHSVVAPDLRGHGRSPFPDDSTMSMAELERDVVGLLGADSSPPVHLVGMSAGGFLALRLAVGHSDRFSSLTLIGSAGHCDAHARAVGQRWSEIYREEGTQGLAIRLLKDLYYPDFVEAHEEIIDKVHASLADRDLRGLLRWGEAIRSFDLRPRLPELRLPTLVVQGMDDQVIDPSHARLLRQTIRGSQVRLLAQTGHMVPIERPTETVEAVRTWAARATPPGGL
jgi:pimeloyl-ACP methyl ester carboxylesterase